MVSLRCCCIPTTLILVRVFAEPCFMVSVDEFGLYTEVFPVLNSGVFGTL